MPTGEAFSSPGKAARALLAAGWRRGAQGLDLKRAQGRCPTFAERCELLSRGNIKVFQLPGGGNLNLPLAEAQL